jgi:hypothetical protein
VGCSPTVAFSKNIFKKAKKLEKSKIRKLIEFLTKT